MIVDPSVQQRTQFPWLSHQRVNIPCLTSNNVKDLKTSKPVCPKQLRGIYVSYFERSLKKNKKTLQYHSCHWIAIWHCLQRWENDTLRVCQGSRTSCGGQEHRTCCWEPVLKMALECEQPRWILKPSSNYQKRPLKTSPAFWMDTSACVTTGARGIQTDRRDRLPWWPTDPFQQFCLRTKGIRLNFLFEEEYSLKVTIFI